MGPRSRSVPGAALGEGGKWRRPSRALSNSPFTRSADDPASTPPHAQPGSLALLQTPLPSGPGGAAWPLPWRPGALHLPRRQPEGSARASAARHGPMRAREIGLPASGTVTWLPASGHAGDGRRAPGRGRFCGRVWRPEVRAVRTCGQRGRAGGDPRHGQPSPGAQGQSPASVSRGAACAPPKPRAPASTPSRRGALDGLGERPGA